MPSLRTAFTTTLIFLISAPSAVSQNRDETKFGLSCGLSGGVTVNYYDVDLDAGKIWHGHSYVPGNKFEVVDEWYEIGGFNSREISAYRIEGRGNCRRAEGEGDACFSLKGRALWLNRVTGVLREKPGWGVTASSFRPGGTMLNDRDSPRPGVWYYNCHKQDRLLKGRRF